MSLQSTEVKSLGNCCQMFRDLQGYFHKDAVVFIAAALVSCE